MRALYITRNYHQKKDGGSVVIKRNLNCFRQLGYDITEFIIEVPSLMTRLKNILFKESYANSRSSKKALEHHLNQQYDIVIFDGSYYGKYLAEFSKHGFKTICFFHNVEAIYYEEKYKASGKLQDKLMVNHIKYNECLCVKYADFIISLNERDSLELNRIYGRTSDFIFPTSFESLSRSKINSIDDAEEYLLFVGTNFFANVEGLQYYINYIANKVTKKLLVVGNVKESFIGKTFPPNVEFLGLVDDLSSYYFNASAVVAPILSGSGLKTKTIEALRYGKTIIGSPEAFEGVPIKEYPKIGYLCNDDQDYIKAINNLKTDKLNQDSIELFELMYSTNAQKSRLKTFLTEHSLL